MESKLINGGDVIEKTAIMEKELQEKQRWKNSLLFKFSNIFQSKGRGCVLLLQFFNRNGI